MIENVPNKSNGLFKAWSHYRSKKLERQAKSEEDNHSSLKSSELEATLETIARIFESIENGDHHIKVVSDRICVSSERGMHVTEDLFNVTINNYFWTDLISVEGSLKLTEASNAISLFKKLIQITSTIIFITTRNFSIQKDLSISA